jgi:hypothetical protein
MFLRRPAMRERAGEHGDGEIGWCVASGNSFDDARRHEGERGEVSDVWIPARQLLRSAWRPA